MTDVELSDAVWNIIREHNLDRKKKEVRRAEILAEKRYHTWELGKALREIRELKRGCCGR